MKKRTNVKPFFDTNILIYAVTAGDQRAETALALLAGGGVVSVQVLNEFVAAAKRKLKMKSPDIQDALASYCLLCPDPEPITMQTHGLALDIADQYGYQIYDSLVIASALGAGCTVLYSEDMQKDQKIRGLRVRNPFQSAKLIFGSE